MWFYNKTTSNGETKDMELRKQLIDRYNKLKNENNAKFENVQKIFLKIKPELNEEILNNLNIPTDDDSYVRIWFHKSFYDVQDFEPEKTYLKQLIISYINKTFDVKGNVKVSIYATNMMHISFDIEVSKLF